jgi:hypothetical protein
LIADASFWSALEDVVGDIEPICYGMNINQKDSTRADEVLLTLAGIFLHFDAHPVPEVANGMKKRIKKRWKDCDQPLFILAVILNPFEGFSHFGDRAGMNHFLCNRLLISVSAFSHTMIILSNSMFRYTKDYMIDPLTRSPMLNERPMDEGCQQHS